MSPSRAPGRAGTLSSGRRALVHTALDLRRFGRAPLPTQLRAIALFLAIAACSGAPHLVGVGEPPSAEDAATRHRIYIVSTRAPSEDDGVFFSDARAGRLNFASVDVSIPPGHQAGRMELPNNPPPDPKEHFVIFNPVRMAESGAFIREIDVAAASRPAGERSALAFVHGYNTNTTEAIVRFAQLIEDTGYRGVPILFTWPSTRRTIDYVADINSAAYSRDGLADTALLLSQSRLESFDLVAHSMGNFLTMEAMRTLSISGQTGRLAPLKTVILAAPDIDLHLFVRQLASVPPSQRKKLVVLISRDDKALRLSRRVAGNKPRLGATDPEAIGKLGVQVIDLTKIDDASSINHSKFAESPEIVQIMGKRLAEGDTLSTETGLAGVFVQELGNVVSVAQQ